MAFDANTIMEWRILYRANEQLNINVLHYHPSQDGVGHTKEELTIDFLNRMSAVTPGEVLTAMSNLWNVTVELEAIEAQIVYPVRYAKVRQEPVLAGVVAGTLTNQNTAAVVTKRGPLGKRNNVGSFHLGGLGHGAFLDGQLNFTALAPEYADLVIQLAATRTTAFGIDYIPVIANKTKVPGSDPPKFVYSGYTAPLLWDVQDTARVMRRRTLRVGV